MLSHNARLAKLHAIDWHHLRRTWTTASDGVSPAEPVTMMDCEIVNGQEDTADGYWYHLPTTSADFIRNSIREAKRPVVSIGFSMVSENDLVFERVAIDILWSLNMIAYCYRASCYGDVLYALRTNDILLLSNKMPSIIYALRT
jgi:hypothetical protein